MARVEEETADLQAALNGEWWGGAAGGLAARSKAEREGFWFGFAIEYRREKGFFEEREIEGFYYY